MKIQLLAFASASEAVGAAEQEIDLEDGSQLADLRRLLEQRFPALAPLWPRLAIAVDGTIADPATLLSDGIEVALLPPVSGGNRESETDVEPTGRVGLIEEAIDATSLSVAVASPSRGAVVLFLGTVRDHHQGRSVVGITYSAYRSMAKARLATIIEELEANAENLRVAITHRLGPVAPGEASVAIVTASPHRAAAYDANRLALERLKREVPIWKREHYADTASTWREEESLVPTHSSPQGCGESTPKP